MAVTKYTNLQKLMMMYVIAWSISPPLQIDTKYRLLAIGCVAVWFWQYLSHNSLNLPDIYKYSIGFAVAVAVIGFIKYQDFSSLIKPMGYYLLVFAFILNYLHRNSWNELEILIPFVLILLVIFNLKTLSIIHFNPNAARDLVRNDESTYSYLRQGAGGYGLLYPQVCIFPMMIAWLMRAIRKNRLFFAAGVAWLISYVLFILDSGYTIAVVATVVSLIILFFYKRKSITLAMTVTLVLIILIVWLIGYVPSVRNFLLDIFDGTKVAKKVNDIYMSVTTDTVADSIFVRMQAYQTSLTSILKFSVLGGLWFGEIGGHSALLDTVAQYGFWGGYLFINMMYCVPMQIKKTTENAKCLQIANASFISTLLITLLNSAPYQFVFLILIFQPILYYDIRKWGNIKK